jgi:hypothetical protein
MSDKKKKIKLTITLSPYILKKLDESSTNKSVFIEYSLLDYMRKNNIKIDDIIL